MGVTLAAGGAFKWYRDVFFECEKQKLQAKGKNIYEVMDDEAMTAKPGSGNLLFLPFLSGERCPYTDPSARGTFIGLTLNHSRAEITRAVMEGVVYSLFNVYELIISMDKSMRANEIRTSGGGSVSNVWRQIQADMFQLPVKTISGSSEGGAFGAAIIAGVGLKLWNSISEAVSYLKVETENIPDTKNRSIYNELYCIYKETYPALKNIFDRLSGAGK